MEVDGGILGLKYRKHTGVLDGIWAFDIANLEGCFKGFPSLVPSYIDPDLVRWDYPFVPRQSAHARDKDVK